MILNFVPLLITVIYHTLLAYIVKRKLCVLHYPFVYIAIADIAPNVKRYRFTFHVAVLKWLHVLAADFFCLWEERACYFGIFQLRILCVCILGGNFLYYFAVL